MENSSEGSNPAYELENLMGVKHDITAVQTNHSSLKNGTDGGSQDTYVVTTAGTTIENNSHSTSGSCEGAKDMDIRRRGLLRRSWKGWCLAIGGLSSLIIAIPIAIYKHISAHASTNGPASGNVSGGSPPTSSDGWADDSRTPAEIEKAGRITTAIMVVIAICLGVGVGLPCRLRVLAACDNRDPYHPVTSIVPTTSSSPATSIQPSATELAGGIANPCQPDFAGSALAVNGSRHVEWGIWGIADDVVIAQIFNRSVSEFLFSSTGYPENGYNIRSSSNLSGVVSSTGNTLTLLFPDWQNPTPFWNVSCEACRPSGSTVPGQVANGCTITVAPAAASGRTCVGLPDAPRKSLTLAPCTGTSGQKFEFWAL